MMFFPFFLRVGLVVATLGVAAPALAQLQLPGAFTPAPAGTVAAPAAAAAPKKPKPKAAAALTQAPADEAVVGRPLMLNGKAGLMEFRRDGKALVVARLKLAGDQIARVGEACEVDIGGPLALKPEGKPAGANRYALELPACPFSVDILNGAALAVTDGKACAFTAADCRVDPAGLWGQPANEIGPQRTKEIERERHGAEQGLRSQFRDWIAQAGKDRQMVSRIAREQAAFSSKREELCRAYARETQHGYCALVATQARSLAVSARILPPAPAADEDETPKRKKNR